MTTASPHSKGKTMAELKPWPLNGYAPGSYMCHCGDCGQTFDGDKRAVTCLECAVLASKRATPASGVAEEMRTCLDAALRGLRFYDSQQGVYADTIAAGDTALATGAQP